MRDPCEIYAPASRSLMWWGTAVLHWRKLLAVLVAVLVLTGVAANATVLPEPPGSAQSHSLPLVRISAHWTPASECAKIGPEDVKRGHYRATMRWCAYTANALHYGELRGKWTWNDGDLSRLMALISCESGGDPRARNPRSSASGLGQFLTGTWNRWAPRAAAFYGFDNPNRLMGYDNILTTVYLAKVGSWSHWRCWRSYE